MPAGSGLFSKAAAKKSHLASAGSDGIGGEVAKLRSDVQQAASALAAIAVEEWVDPPAAAVNAIKLSVATSIAPQVYAGAAFDGVVGAAVLNGPRPISVTQATGNHYAGTVTVKGRDAQNKIITDTIALTANPGIITTTATAKYFAQVTEIDVPAQQDALGHFQFGTYGNDVGLSRAAKGRTGAFVMIQELMDGSVPTAGALVSPTLAPPYGAYAPNTAPDPAQPAAITGTTDITSSALYSTPAVVTGSSDITVSTLYGVAAPAILTGTVDITAGTLYGGSSTLDGESLTLNVNGAGATTLALNKATNCANEAALLAAITAQWPALASAVQGGPGGNKLVLTTTATTTAATIAVTTTTGSTALGLSGSVAGSGDLDGLTLILNVNVAGPLTLTLNGATNTASEAALLAAIHVKWAAITATAVATNLTLTTLLQGTGASITVGAGTANTALGLTPATTTGTAGTLNAETLILNVDGAGPLTLTFAMATSSASEAAMLAAIVALWPGLTAVAGGAGGVKLVLTTTATGVLASIVVGAGTADTALGISGSSTGNAGHDYSIMYEYDATLG